MLGFDALGRLALGEAPTAAATAYAVTADGGSFTLSGQEMVSAVSMPAEVGAFTVAGSAGLVVSMPAEAGSFTITGQASVAQAVFRLRCDPFLATTATHFGAAPLGALALGQGFLVTETSISFALSGGEAVFRHTMAAEAGSFVVTGQNMLPFEGNILTAQAGSFALTFQQFGTSITLPMGTGAFTLTGQAELARRSPKIRRFPRVGSTTATARSRGAGVKVRAYGG